MPARPRQRVGVHTDAVVSTNSAFPGNAYKPLDTLPLRPPPLRTPAMEQVPMPLIKGADAPMPYAAFESARHLHPDVDVDGKISVLPFNVSPRSLPAMLQHADQVAVVREFLLGP